MMPLMTVSKFERFFRAAADKKGSTALQQLRQPPIFTIVDPELKNPQTEQWERVFRIFDLLL